MDVVCLGELLVDLFPAEVGRPLAQVSSFRPVPGGAPANVAVAASRLGAKVGFIGKVGDDAFGRHLAQVLAAEGVDVRGVRFDAEARTTLAFIAQPDVNSYDILFYRNPGADTRLRPEELDGDLLRATRAFHFGSLSLIEEPSRSATLEAVRVAREAGALVSFDVNYRPTLWSPDAARLQIEAALPLDDVLKVNEAELGLLTGESDAARGGQRLLARGPALVLVTLGPEGCVFCCAAGAEHVPAYAVETVDATGCGDAFVAGLLTGLQRERDWPSALRTPRLHEIVRRACAAGALTATRQGAIPALPTAAELEAFLAGR